MTFKKFNPCTLTLLLILMVVAALRLHSHFIDHYSPITNFTPIGAMALFGGAYFTGNIKPFAFPLLALFFSDLILSFTIYSQYRTGLLYGGWFWIYLAFTVMTVAGKFIIKKVTIGRILLATLVSVFIHWLVSDIGGCLKGDVTEAALIVYGQRLITAIPYELRFLAGTAIFSAIMFGSFEWLKKNHPSLNYAE